MSASGQRFAAVSFIEQKVRQGFGARRKRDRSNNSELFVKGSSRSANKPPAFDLATAQRVVEQQDGEVPLPQRLLCRIRYFTDGVILGSMLEGDLISVYAVRHSQRGL